VPVPYFILSGPDPSGTDQLHRRRLRHAGAAGCLCRGLARCPPSSASICGISCGPWCWSTATRSKPASRSA